MSEDVYFLEKAASGAAPYESAAERKKRDRKIALWHSKIRQLADESYSTQNSYDVRQIAGEISRDVAGVPPIDRIVSAATISTDRTNPNGTFSISKVAAGEYYIHATVETRKTHLEWFVPVSVTGSDAMVTLDTNNATISVDTGPGSD